MKRVRRLAASIILVIAVFYFPVEKGFAAEGDDWMFSIEPYLMATSIEGDASIGRATGADVDVNFEDILESLEAAFMVRGEIYHKSGWGLLFDYGFMKLGADISGPMDGVINTEIRQGVLETFIAKKLTLVHGDWELYTGVRWWKNDLDVTVDTAIYPGTINLSVNEGWVDPVIGAKVGMPLSESFSLVLRGDAGGFGISSNFTALVSAGFNYRFTEMISLDIRYKAIWVDYENGTKMTPDYFSYNTVTHGPIAGVIFSF